MQRPTNPIPPPIQAAGVKRLRLDRLWWVVARLEDELRVHQARADVDETVVERLVEVPVAGTVHVEGNRLDPLNRFVEASGSPQLTGTQDLPSCNFLSLP